MDSGKSLKIGELFLIKQKARERSNNTILVYGYGSVEAVKANREYEVCARFLECAVKDVSGSFVEALGDLPFTYNNY